MLFSYESENFKFYEFIKFQVLVQVFYRDESNHDYCFSEILSF